LTELKLDSTGIENATGRVFTFSPFVTDERVNLQPGSVYHVEAEATDFPTARTARVQYVPVLRIDSVVDPLQIRNGLPGRYAETVRFNAIGEILRSVSGTVDVRVRIVDSISDVTLSNQRLDFRLSGGFQTVVVNPGERQALPEFEFTNISGARRVGENDRYVIYTFLFQPESFLEVKEAIQLQNNGGGSEDFNGEGVVRSPINSNAESGFGYFTIVEKYDLKYEL